MGLIAVELEKAGIPTTFVLFEDQEATFLAQAGLNGQGVLPAVTVSAAELMEEARARQAGREVVDDVVSGLTRGIPPYLERNENRLIPSPSVLTFRGEDYGGAYQAFMETFTERRWGDGLPLIPPTPERVEWVLAGTDRTPGTVLGAMGPSMGEVTVRQLAINAAMAGARPEHLPVIIAAMEAITAYPYDYHAPLARGVAPLVIVNGPIVDQLGINHAQNELGPHPGYPAGAVIGRAINLAMRNLGGFGRGYVPPAQHGQPGTYTGLVIGEAEDVVPWTPLNVELGFERGTNTVTVLGVSGTVGVPGPNPEHAAAFVPPSIPFWPSTRFAWQRSTVGVLLVTPLQARRFFGQGRSKQDIKEVLYTYARTPRDEFERTWQLDEFEPTGLIGWLLRTTPEDEPIPIAAGPDSFLVVTAGGWDSSVAFSWLFTDLYMNVPTTKVVHLPPDWEDLLSER